MLGNCTHKNVWQAPEMVSEHCAHQIEFSNVKRKIQIEHVGKEQSPAQRGWACGVTQGHSCVLVLPRLSLLPQTSQSSLLSCVWPLSSTSLVIGKFQLNVTEPVTIHPVQEVLSWIFWGPQGKRVRMSRPTLDSDVRKQHILSTQMHEHTSRSITRRAGLEVGLSVHRDQRSLECICQG